MTGGKAQLLQFEEKADPFVTFVDNNKGFKMGYGKNVLKMLSLINVALVADLEVSLFRISIL